MESPPTPRLGGLALGITGTRAALAVVVVVVVVIVVVPKLRSSSLSRCRTAMSPWGSFWTQNRTEQN